MALHIILMLFFAGIAGGMITSLVGGAAVVTYPALIAAGIAPLPATTCNLTAAVPGAFFAALSDRKQLPPFDRAFVGMVLASMIGAGIGALVLLATPERLSDPARLCHRAVRVRASGRRLAARACGAARARHRIQRH